MHISNKNQMEIIPLLRLLEKNQLGFEAKDSYPKENPYHLYTLGNQHSHRFPAFRGYDFN